MQRSSNVINLALGTLGIYVTFCLAGLLQQYMILKPYLNWSTGEEEYLDLPLLFNLIPAVVSWAVGAGMNSGNKKKTYIPAKNLIACSMLVVISSLTFTKAIYLTNFPIVMMFKSCNMLSIISVSVFCSKVLVKQQRLEKKNLITGGIVTIGILCYYLGGNEEHVAKALNPFGLLLLIISLLSDGFLPDFQAEIKVNYKPTPLEMFEDTNKWKTIIYLIYAVLFMQIIDNFAFMLLHPLSIVHLFALGMLSAVGQIVVFWMIKLFRQHIVPFIITTRKITTTLLSILFFNHSMEYIQYIGILITIAVVVFDFYREIRHQSREKLPDESEVRLLQNQQNSLIEEQVKIESEDIEVRILQNEEKRSLIEHNREKQNLKNYFIQQPDNLISKDLMDLKN